MGKYRNRASSALVVSVLCAAFCGCRSPENRGDGGRLSDGGRPSRGRADAADCEQSARLSTAPRVRAKHYLEAADIYLDLRLFQEAKRCLQVAREAYYAGEIAGRMNRMFGEVYLESGEVILAERYLLKGLDDSGGEERELTLARLVAAAKARGDEVAAARYRSRLSTPYRRDVRTVLETKIEPVFPRTSSSLQRALTRRAVQRPAPRTSRTLQAASVSILPRWKWRARPIRGNTTPMSRIGKITVHHTGGEESFWGRTLQSAADEIRRTQKYHQKQGWADIGYHFLIDRAGNIWQGRSLKYQGAHARHENPGNIGISVLGNYTRQKLTPEQRESLTNFIAVLSSRYSVPPDRVYTHKEILQGKTACPGPEISRFVNEVRWKLRSVWAVAYRR